jgi:uncharacterized protein (DUF1501 family)
MGEFGRTPLINPNAGRDHFPAAWSAVLAGGGIAVVDGQVDEEDLLTTLCHSLGLEGKSNMAPSGRPIPLADGKAIDAVLA